MDGRGVSDFSQSARQHALYPSNLCLVSQAEVEILRAELARGIVPADLESKLSRLAKGGLRENFIEQNCRTIIALLSAAREGEYKGGDWADYERLLRVLAYVRKDDDAIPDYRPNGFDDDQQELRAAMLVLSPLLQRFKEWRLRHQVPELWLANRGVCIVE
jgi:hypothetical protein